MKTILISGGAGFIGSHLCDFATERGDTVICLDNLISGTEKNVAHLLSKKNFNFINFDVSQPFLNRKFSKIDEIYHLASPADPNAHSRVSYIAHPFETMKVNSIGTWNMCDLALKTGARLLFASTSEIYGDPEKSPQDENYRGNVSTTGPRSVYDESKRFGETIVAAFVREKAMDGRIVRIFNTYGPRMNVNEGRAVVNFIKEALENKPLTIYGSGSQTRSFCYVSDQVEGLINAMETESAKGEVINIGNPDEKTILEFAKTIKRLTNSESEISYNDLPQDDPKQRKPDIQKARVLLGWQPKVNLETGLLETINYFKKVL